MITIQIKYPPPPPLLPISEYHIKKMFQDKVIKQMISPYTSLIALYHRNHDKMPEFFELGGLQRIIPN